MHEQHEIEIALKAEATRISQEYGHAPVVILVGGSKAAGVPRVMTASAELGRLRDLIGILQTSVQIETLKHFRIPPFSRNRD